MAMPADAAAPPPFDLEASMDVAMAMSSPTLSSSAAAAAAAAAAFILHDPHTALPALMPNKFTMLRDDSLTELEFQDIHRFLSQETSTEKVLTPKQNLSTNQPLSTYSKRNARHNETEGLEALEKSFPSVRQEYPDGKENNPLPRRGFLRREGSGRITSHRPFKVDLRSFGSILNKGGLGDSEIPRDVHAFWEAEDEKEASEAIMRKVRGEDKPCSQQSELGNSRLRQPCVRRKGSQRRTKSRCIKLDLPFYAKQVQLLDKEQLEEEEAVNVESCTFSKHLELTMDKSLPAHQRLEISDSQPRNSLAMNSDTVSFDVVPSDDEMQIVLSDGDSPALSTKEDSCHAGNQTDINDSINAQIEDLKGPQTLWKDSDNLQMPDEESVVPVGSTAGQREGNTVEEAKGGLANAMKVTPYDKDAIVDRIPSTSPTPPSNPLAAYDKGAVVNRTPLTSPTPPSNPLAALGYKKGNFPEGMGKRKLDFEDTIDSPLRQPALQTSTGKDSPCLRKVSASPVKTVQEKSPAVREETSLVASEVTGSNTNKSTPQLKVLKKKSAKKKRLVKLRNSLEGAGTNWNNGVRRSTRIRSRPLEYWRGERFLFGRIHETLTTVIGIKYSSPPPCWPKRGAACPKFKVESYVSDKYADHIRLAALG